MEERFYCHEIGHGIIAHLFNGYITNFSGITFEPTVVRGANLNVHDLGYTITTPTVNIAEMVSNDNRKAAAVDGLMLLAGIAGATFLPPVSRNYANKDAVTLENFTKVLDIRGSEGDFEIILRRRRPYGWYLFTVRGYSEVAALEVHSRLINVLKQLFISEDIQNGAKALYDLITSRDNQSLSLQDFSNVFNARLVARLSSYVCKQLSVAEFSSI